MKTSLLLIGLALSSVFAQNNPKIDAAREAQIRSLQQEIQSLERQKMDKAKKLEDAEARRWDQRYRENAEIKKLEDQNQQWEGAYGRLADELSRTQEEVIAAKTSADAVVAGIEGVKTRVKGFEMQVAQSADKLAGDVAGDFPLGLNERTQSLSQASALASAPVPRTEQAMNLIFADRAGRLAQTQKVGVSTVKAVFPDRIDVSAWRLQLGTIFLAEVQKEGSGAQMLLRSGTIAGQLFAWNSDLKPEVLQSLQQSAQAWASARMPLALPMDLLQDGGISKQVSKKAENTLWQSFVKWFKEGGLVMWPLIALFVISLVLIVERALVFALRSYQLQKDIKSLLPLMREGRLAETQKLAAQRSSALARLAETLIHGQALGREWADKTLRQVLFREIPSLEKRLPFIASLGTTAPLLGLLGTVSGMVKLFSVITEVGTNDTRILSAGISEALVATEAGLLVAIPAMLLHGLLTEKLDSLLSKLKAHSMEMLNLLHQEEKEAQNVD